MSFDAFHDFAGRLEFGFALEGDTRADRDFGDVIFPLNILKQTFGFAFISGRDQVLGLSEREECQHHARDAGKICVWFAMPKADYAAWPKPAEIAQVILFLCSEQARLIHGAAIPVFGNS